MAQSRWIKAVMSEYRKNKKGGLKTAIKRAKAKYKKRSKK